MNKIISIFLKSGEINLNAPLGPILSQYEYDFQRFINNFNELTVFWKNFDLVFPVFLFLLQKKKYDFLIKLPTTIFFINFFSINNKIKKTDLYNISKIKSNFYFWNIKNIYILIINTLKTLKINIQNE